MSGVLIKFPSKLLRLIISQMGLNMHTLKDTEKALAEDLL